MIGWDLVGVSRRLSVFANQGLTSLSAPDRARVVYRGDWSIPLDLRRRGWLHVGDPSSWRGTLFDAYQTRTPSNSKLFVATTPDGNRRLYEHRLVDGELFNNSFACVSSNGQWMLSGEWGAISRLLVFPTPLLNQAAESSNLELATFVELNRPVRNIQGATFIDESTLLCSTDDPDTDLWPTPRQLVQIKLAKPLDGGNVTAEVESLGQIETESLCRGQSEVEGIDYDVDGDVLRISIIPPGICGQLFTHIQKYRRLL